MSIIKISELRPAGSELFQDAESYLNELNPQDLGMIEGGKYGPIVITSLIEVNSQASISVGVTLETVSAVTKFY